MGLMDREGILVGGVEGWCQQEIMFPGVPVYTYEGPGGLW